MKRVLFLAIGLMAAVCAGGQRLNVDSLINALESKQLTTDERMKLYIDICNQFIENDNDKFIKYSHEALKFAEKEQKKDEATIIYSFLGLGYYTKSSYDTSFVYLQKSLDIAKEINDIKGEIRALNYLGNLFRRQSNFETAIDYYSKAMVGSEQIGDSYKVAIAMTNISAIYRMTDNLDKSIEYLSRAEKICNEIKDNYLFLNVYYNLGTVYSLKGQDSLALEYALKANELSIKEGEKKFEIAVLDLLSRVYKKRGELDKSQLYAEQCVSVAEGYDDKRMLMSTYTNLADIYFSRGFYKECEAMSLKSWNIDSTDLVNAKDASHYLVLSSMYLNKNEQAQYYLAKYDEIIAQRNDKQYNDALANMEIKYETDKKETRIASLEKERKMYILFGLAAGLLLIALGALFWLTLRNAQKEKQLIATRSFLNGEMKERTRLAQDLHDRLSGNLNALKIDLNMQLKSLESINVQLDNCINEIRNVAHDLMPATLQYGLKVALEDFAAKFPTVHFHFFGTDNRFESRLEYVMYCCAAELVNNSIKHANATEIHLQLVLDERYATLSVSDNGSGFNEKSAGEGLGLKSIRNRVASCNGKLDINSSPDKGTETSIELRIEKEPDPYPRPQPTP
ncbi:MAG: tetratricopeptide repeat protein [Tannerella sp.]|jgi:signal transduction histidine kinase|nr:tetratricopeptide repeat protein [Tannerella sp.]